MKLKWSKNTELRSGEKQTNENGTKHLIHYFQKSDLISVSMGNQARHNEEVNSLKSTEAHLSKIKRYISNIHCKKMKYTQMLL